MALTPEIRSSQGGSLAAAESGSPFDVSLGAVFGAINFPTDFIRASQGAVISALRKTPNMQVSQAAVLAAIRGTPANPTVRAWTFTLDGHDYYVLRLGDDDMLVYDRFSKQWMDWRSGEANRVWRANTGLNWAGATAFAASFGSNIIVGDDSFGLLWLLDPLQGFDQAPASTSPDQPFARIVSAQVVARMRDVIPCYEIFITTDMGSPAFTGASVSLLMSDDAGKNFDNMGTIEAVLGDDTQEFSWTSLGQIEAPGRLFRVVDNGAFARIDAMDMADPFPKDDD